MAIIEDRQVIRASVLEMADLAEPQRQKILKLLDRPIDTSALKLRKNVKSVSKNVDIQPTPPSNRNVLAKTAKLSSLSTGNATGKVNREGLVDLPDKCHECNTQQRRGRL